MRTLLSGVGLGVTIVSALAAQDPGTTATSPKAAWLQFRSEHPGDWIAQWHPATGTPSAIFGTGIALDGWRTNTLAAARGFAGATLASHHDLLGLGTSDFVESIGARMGRCWSFTYDQRFHGVPVIGGRADVRINMKGVVAMLGSRAWPIPADFVTAPTIAGDVAEAIAWAKVGQRSEASQPGAKRPTRLVIWGDVDAAALAPVFLAWEVPVSNVDRDGDGPIGRHYVDAHTGAHLAYVSDKHECGLPGCTATPAQPTADVAAPPVATTVTVMGWTITGNDAFDPVVNTPLPGLELNVPGIGVVTTDQNGQFTIDIAAPVGISVGALDGRHHAAIQGSDGPTGTFTVNPGVNATIQLLTSGATSLESAHTNTSWWVDRANQWVRTIVGNSTQLNTADAVAPTVNIGSTCNAYYTGNTINFYAAGGSCSNTAFSTVVVHEWGHGLDDRYGGISNQSGDGLSEGWGDIIGLYLVDSPVLGSGFSTAGVGIRDGNNSTMYGTQSEVHAAGEVWMGFAWRYRENLRANYGTPAAIAISDETVVGSIVANAFNQADAVREVFLADDDDGNLTNGVPHFAELSAAAIAKGLPYPGLQPAWLQHTPLTNTPDRGVPRVVTATAAANTGALTAVRLHYDAGQGSQVRNMHPSGVADTWVAMLPGREVGAVSYHLEVVHSSGFSIRLPEAGEIGYAVDAGTFAGFWSDDLESGAAGWTHGLNATQDDWQLGYPAGKSGTSLGVDWQDPTSPASGANCWANDLGNVIGGTTYNGYYAANVDNWLRSPVIDCSGRAGMRLRFKRWLSVEEAIYDHATILVNGVEVWGNQLNGHTLDTGWTTVEYLIPMADDNPAVQIEWHLTSDGGLELGGWAIDDIELGETVLPPADATLAMLPEQASQGATMTLTVTTPLGSWPYVLGLGTTAGPLALPDFPVMAIGGTIDALSGTTGPGGTATVTFTAPNLPSAVGLFLYSQVLTIDPTFTSFVVSNPFVNLFTQTP
ncbi:MAG: M36 family metallopeptidase [Planctomycetes bacterium]|nr:M36 family metallopeptidase [Planctomycetota bacterium]